MGRQKGWSDDWEGERTPEQEEGTQEASEGVEEVWQVGATIQGSRNRHCLTHVFAFSIWHHYSPFDNVFEKEEYMHRQFRIISVLTTLLLPIDNFSVIGFWLFFIFLPHLTTTKTVALITVMMIADEMAKFLKPHPKHHGVIAYSWKYISRNVLPYGFEKKPTKPNVEHIANEIVESKYGAASWAHAWKPCSSFGLIGWKQSNA